MPTQYRAIWSTPGGGTGYTVLHFNDISTGANAAALAAATRTFFDGNKGVLPDDVTITFDDEVTVYTLGGALTTVLPVTPPASVTGINSTSFNRAAGARIDWSTGTIVAGRRLVGRTFLVPCGSSTFDTTGLVTTGNITNITATGTALIAATATISPLVVWSKTHGVVAPVVTCSVPAKGAILSGRRD